MIDIKTTSADGNADHPEAITEFEGLPMDLKIGDELIADYFNGRAEIIWFDVPKNILHVLIGFDDESEDKAENWDLKHTLDSLRAGVFKRIRLVPLLSDEGRKIFFNFIYGE